jgi:hypothetical protein
MPRLSRPTACLVVAVALLSALGVWDRLAGGRGDSPLSVVLAQFDRAETERANRIETGMATALARRERANRLFEEVASGRVSLLEGAAALRETYQDVPDSFWLILRREYPDESDDSRLCRLLIRRMAVYLEKDPDRARAVVSRLEAEREEHVRRGALRLPE